MSHASGPVVALIGTGTADDRSVALACAKAGARLALGTATRDSEFAMASISNEIWAGGGDQFLRVMDGADAAEVTAFAAEVYDRFGGCDGLVLAYRQEFEQPFDQLALEDWDEALRVNLTGPFLAMQAFGRLMERAGRGRILVDAGARMEPTNTRATRSVGEGGVAGLVAALADWHKRGVVVSTMPPGDGATVVTAISA